ncbi:hypothetical protein A4G19_02200 [Pasteurellaceae bacterium Macca]|nr:hypothetical protein [Pasteurellaceae bacterium Macca]
MTQTQTLPPRIIRRNAVIGMFGVSKTTFAEWQNPKSKRYRPDFPKRVQLGVNSVGYLESEVTAYIHKLAEQSSNTEACND